MTAISRPQLVRDVLDDTAKTMILVYCNRPTCLHGGTVLLSAFLDRGAHLDTPIPELKRWCKCSKCDSKDVQTRSDPYPVGVQGVPNV